MQIIIIFFFIFSYCLTIISVIWTSPMPQWNVKTHKDTPSTIQRLKECWQSSGVDFINVLRTSFMPVVPQSVRTQSRCQYLFTLLGSTHVKAVHITLFKLTPCWNNYNGSCSNKIVAARSDRFHVRLFYVFHVQVSFVLFEE